MSSSCSYYSDNVLASDTEGKSFKPGLLEFKMHPIRNLRHALVDVKVDWGSSRRCESGLVNESTTSLRERVGNTLDQELVAYKPAKSGYSHFFSGTISPKKTHII